MIEFSNHMCQCVSRGWWEQDNFQLKMDGLKLDNSRLTTCALELESSAFSALELDHSRLRTCARELDNFGWCALELGHSKFGTHIYIHIYIYIHTHIYIYTKWRSSCSLGGQLGPQLCWLLKLELVITFWTRKALINTRQFGIHSWSTPTNTPTHYRCLIKKS